MGKFKRYKFSLFLFFISFFLFLFWSFPVVISASKSSCVSCHTSGSKLIKIMREIEARKPKVEKSAESEGEG
jgi:hypothetical protein